MKYQTIRDAEIKDKTVLVRVDYNVPMKDGKITNDLRIRASLPTLNYLIENGAKKIVLISHLGRPEGKPDANFTLSPVADHLRKLLPSEKIGFYDLPTPSSKPLSEISDVKIALLENLRFDPREEANDPSLIKEIIDFVKPDFYVQDGFAVAHRAHASVSAVQDFLPVYFGFLVEKELENLTKVIKNPTHPFLFIIGGAKVEDKSPLIEKFSKIADHIVVGGKIAADGFKSDDPKIYIAEDFDEDAEGHKLDIGPISATKICEYIDEAETIVWNGLLGKAEDPAYSTSSTIIADAIGHKHATTIICGGDTAGFVEKRMTENKDLEYSLVSTGGGAAIAFLSGEKLKIFK